MGHRILHSRSPASRRTGRPKKGRLSRVLDAPLRARSRRYARRSTERPIEGGTIFRVGRRSILAYSLGGEAAAATAGALHVRVVELEIRTVEPFHVVDFSAVEVLEAQRIDVKVDAVR